MPVPRIYRTATNIPSIKSYDFVDIVSGRGVIVFYGGKVSTSLALANSINSAAFTLSPTQFYSNDPAYSTIPTQNNLSVDFDALIKVPFIVDGRAIINVPIRDSAAGTARTISASIRKIPFIGTASIIASLTQAYTVSGTGAKGTVQTIAIDIPKTTFRKNDVLRLNVNIDSYAGGTLDLIYDPKNRSTIDGNSWTVVDSTMLNVQLSVVPDL